jgi:hypothetical protein
LEVAVARRHRLYVALVTLTMVMSAAVPAGAGGVEDPTTPFSDEFDGTTNLSLYIFDRYTPSSLTPWWRASSNTGGDSFTTYALCADTTP